MTECEDPLKVSVDDQDIDVQFTGLLAQAQRALGVQPIERTLAFVTTHAEAFPEMLDKIDPLEAVDQFAGNVGTHPKIIRSNDEALAVAANRAEQQQKQEQAAAAPGLARAAKDVSEIERPDGGQAIPPVAG